MTRPLTFGSEETTPLSKAAKCPPVKGGLRHCSEGRDREAGERFTTKKRDGYADSDILMTKDLLAIDAWDTAAIEKRQRELSEWVFDIWKFPGEAAPANWATGCA